jgi:hypothetical protein
MMPPNLVLTFTITGDRRVHIKGAARIKLDGRGGLTLYSAENGQAENVSLQNLETLSIQTIEGLFAGPLGMIQ